MTTRRAVVYIMDGMHVVASGRQAERDRMCVGCANKSLRRDQIRLSRREGCLPRVCLLGYIESVVDRTPVSANSRNTELSSTQIRRILFRCL